MNTKLLPIPTSNAVPAVKDCVVCQGQEKLWTMTKNRKNINKAIGLYKEKVHGIPYPQQQQQNKKQKISNGAGGPPSSDEESNDGAIDGFVF